MQDVFEKIIEKLKKELKLADEEKLRCARENPLQFDSAKGYAHGVGKAIEIVKQEAKQYNNGWIPYSERLPENISTVILQVEEIEKPTFGFYGNMNGWRLTEKDFVELKDFTVIAWQPLPQPYQPKGE